MTTRLLLLHALTPLHSGVGQGVGAIDLAIARDRATGFPYLPGSSIKGSLRSVATAMHLSNLQQVFGPDTVNASDHAGGVVFSDANLLALPVRSVVGTFGWVTSPYLLSRFARDAREAGISFGSFTLPSATDRARVTGASVLKTTDQKILFEDLDFKADEDEQVSAIATLIASLAFEDPEQRASFVSRFCVVHDDAMSFLSQHATDVVTRVALEAETKTVKTGQLWTEENLPTETLLVSLVIAMPNARTGDADSLLERVHACTSGVVQFGGNATVGRGRCNVRMTGGEA